MENIKIKYIVNARMPTEKAHGIQIMKTCEALAKKGVDLTLIIPRRSNKIKEDVFDYYGVERIFKIKRVLSFNLMFLGKIGFWIQTFSFGVSSFFYLLFFTKGLAVVYSRGETLLLIYKFLPKRFSVFWETHIKPKRGLKYYKIMLRKITGVITVTEYYKRELMEDFNLPESKVICVPDGVDENVFDVDIQKEKARERLGLSKDKKIAVYTGSLSLYKWKGVDVFLKAALKLPKDYLCVLVGGNDKEIEKLKGEFTKNVLFTGYKEPNLMPLYLKAANVLVLPNKKGDDVSEYYTSPMKLFEYMASGVPIVASDLVSIREILNKDNSALVEPNNPESLAEGIKYIAENKDRGEILAKRAYEEVKLKYTWEKRAGNILEFIRKSA